MQQNKYAYACTHATRIGFSIKHCFMSIFSIFTYLDIDECTADPDLCQNAGACVNKPESFTCTCADGWTGSLCTQGS